MSDCTCKQGYTKNTSGACVIQCPSPNCSGHGKCDTSTGKCTCDAGWKHDNCATMDPASCKTCNPRCGNGTCGPCIDKSTGYCYNATGNACPSGTTYCCDSSTTNTVVKAKPLQGTSTKWATK